MQKPEIPVNEAERLAALRALDVLDTGSEERFDRLTRLAAFIAGTPIALVSLVDEHRQWFKSRVGLDADETPRDISFCGHAILGDAIFEVPDASKDPRFADNPLVTNAPDIRFYAGVPLTLVSGHSVGTLCVIDQTPRSLTAERKALLKDLGQTVVDELMMGDVIRRARKQLAQSEELRATVATVADGILSISADGTIQRVNPAVLSLFGYQEDELLGRNVNVLMPEPYHSAHDGYLERYLAGGEARVIGNGRDVIGRRKDGSVFPMHLAVSEMELEGQRYFAGVVHDKTEETLLQEELQRSLELQQAIVDSASVAIISTDNDGTILSFNRGAETLLGYQAEELIKQATPALFQDADEVAARAQQLSDELGRVIKPGFEAFVAKARLGTVDRNEWTYIHRGGRRIPVELAVSSLRSPSGSVQGFLGIAIDISQRKDAERAKSEFISTVSHELRTPLTSVRGALGLVLAKFAGDLPEKAINLLQNANRNSERLSLLINDILDIEKLDAGRMDFDLRIADLREMVDQSMANNQSFADKYNVRLKLKDSLASAPARMDSHRLQQVMSNLLSNAIKYAPAESTVEVSLTASGNNWRIGVRDHGRGIPEAFRSQIFQRFSQADSSDAREKGGSGLGLSISRAIVEQHQGRIGFQTGEATGTEFYFELPRVDHSEAELPAGISDKELPRILVCTESDNVGDALCLLLSHNRFHGDQCSPENAQRMLLDKIYQALLLDLSHGGDAGLLLLQRIRANQQTQDIPVIVIASEAQPAGMEAKLHALNVYNWLQKPVDRQQLERALRACGRRGKNKPSLLHVEDDLDVVQIVKSVTEDIADYDYAGSLGQAMEKLRARAYDLVLLDLGLPDGDGRSLLGMIPPLTRVIIFSGEQITLPEEGDIIASLVKSQVTNDHLLATLTRALQQPDGRQIGVDHGTKQ